METGAAMSEQTMTVSEVMRVLDRRVVISEALNAARHDENRAIRAAVAELVSEVERVKESNTALTDEVMDRDIENARLRDERDALRRRVEELEEQKKAADIECKYQMGKAWASLEANKVLQDLVDRKNDVLKTLLDTGRLLDVHECLVAKALSWEST